MIHGPAPLPVTLQIAAKAAKNTQIHMNWLFLVAKTRDFRLHGWQSGNLRNSRHYRTMLTRRCSDSAVAAMPLEQRFLLLISGQRKTRAQCLERLKYLAVRLRRNHRLVFLRKTMGPSLRITFIPGSTASTILRGRISTPSSRSLASNALFIC